MNAQSLRTNGAMAAAGLMLLGVTSFVAPRRRNPVPPRKAGQEWLGIATADPYQTYHEIGLGLAEVLQERLPDRLPKGLYHPPVTIVTDGSVQNATLVASSRQDS